MLHGLFFALLKFLRQHIWLNLYTVLLILNFSLSLERGMCDLRAQIRLYHEPTELKFLDTSRTLIQWPYTE